MPKPPFDRETFRTSMARVESVPQEQRAETIAQEAASMGISADGWRSRRRRVAREDRSSGIRVVGVTENGVLRPPPFADPPSGDVFERARLAAAADGEDPSGGGEASPRNVTPPAEAPDSIGADFVVTLSVVLIQIAGRVAGALMHVPPHLAASASVVTPEERKSLLDAAPLALPWIRQQLGDTGPQAGLLSYLMVVGVTGFTKVQNQQTIRDRIRQMTARPESNPTDIGSPASTIPPPQAAP